MIDRRELLLSLGAMTAAGGAAGGTGHGPTGIVAPAAAKVLPRSWKNAEVIPLWPAGVPGADAFVFRERPSGAPEVFLQNIASPDLHVFRPSHPDGRSVLVIPGGAYTFVSVANEGADVAAKFCPLEVTVFVLAYRLPGEGWRSRADVPLQDAQRAMRVIRARAAQFKVDPQLVGVIGFSAGGHLAATLATAHQEVVYAAVDEEDRLSPRPHSVALVYPVITMLPQWTHAESRRQLLGESPTDDEVARRCPELHVGPQTPPTFLVHAIDDDAVPVENSVRMLNALRAAGRPVEAHLLQEGHHAFGVGIDGRPSGLWISTYLAWSARLAEGVT